MEEKTFVDDINLSLIHIQMCIRDRAEEFRMIEVGFRPTAEHFSKYFYELMSVKGFPIHREMCIRDRLTTASLLLYAETSPFSP